MIRAIREFFFNLSLSGCPDCNHAERDGFTCKRHAEGFRRLYS